MDETARRRGDARVSLVGLAFLAAGGFLALHALATPGVLLGGSTAGFTIATPVGLVNASLLALASSLDLEGGLGEAIAKRRRALRALLLGVIVVWGAISLASLPPLDDPLAEEEAEGTLRALALAGVVLYAVAGVRYLALWRRTRAPVTLAVLTAWVLLAEAMVAVAFGRNWHITWWEWHVLMAVAFALVAYTARVEQRRRQPGGPFASLYLERTIARTNSEYATALGQLVQGRASPGEVAQRFGLSGEQAELVDRAAARIRELDERYRPYLSARLAERLAQEPEEARLGGEEREVSVLFADLAGFTAYSETRPPAEVIAMLNEYWGTAVPVVLERYAGMIERFAGDAVMVVFNAYGDQPDHARRAAATALELQTRTEELAVARPGWPRFRVGVNTGLAAVGFVGTEQQRSFAVIGDTTNTAARLQTAARTGEVVISAATRERLGGAAVVEELPAVEAKGKREPVRAFRLVTLDER